MQLVMMNREEKKSAFPILLYNRLGNIAQTCYDLSMTRQTYYKWMREDEEFAQSVEDAREALIDIGESALIRNVKKGVSTDIQFLLKTRGRDRGYGEKVAHEVSGQVNHSHGVTVYPFEPVSIEDWERQVIEAETAHKALTDPPPSDPPPPDQPLAETGETTDNEAIEAPATSEIVEAEAIEVEAEAEPISVTTA